MPASAELSPDDAVGRVFSFVDSDLSDSLPASSWLA